MAYGDKKVILIVAVEGAVQDWAAYFKYVDNSVDVSIKELIEYVATRGDKLLEETARPLFRDWAKKLSWRR